MFMKVSLLKGSVNVKALGCVVDHISLVAKLGMD